MLKKLFYWLGQLPSQILGVLSCVFLFFMMLLTFIDVGGRYFFSSPLPAAYEIIAFTMPCIIFCALPAVNLREGHVTIDLFDTFIPERLKYWQRFFVLLISTVVMGFISWRLATRSYDHFRFHDVTDELYIPLWYFSLMMAILSFIAAITLLMACINVLTANDKLSAPVDDDGARL